MGTSKERVWVVMYDIIFSSKSLKKFKKLDNSIQKKVEKRIEKLKHNPERGKRLSGNMYGFLKLKMDKFRIIYSIDRKKVIIYVFDIERRDRVY